ncbi:F0F1 ATP synthase subunit C [Ammoniphilus oxalaticus]|uniref:ATP synthase subunit c n=1 Tax=Ammoniphilus oxalaticus TaxID=66863 RepID=A0A419SGY9_9BACL|nr:F0F1 ATP synthase subunit C [Ammoniphilus oxalaticus]RKD23064.1 F0F1 ATP synthase subunit C [Ammoniphilus oxalaticus]
MTGVLAAAIIAAAAAIGASIGIGMIVGNTVKSMARQPEIRGNLQTTMFIGIGLLEGIPIIAIVIAFMALGS